MDLEILIGVIIVHILRYIKPHATQGVHQLAHGVGIHHEVVVGEDTGEVTDLMLEVLDAAALGEGRTVYGADPLVLPGHIHRRVPGDGEKVHFSGLHVVSGQEEGIRVFRSVVRPHDQEGVYALPAVEKGIAPRLAEGEAGDGAAVGSISGILPAAEGQHRRQGCAQQHQYQGGNGHLRPFGDEKDALLHGSLFVRHGGGGAEEAGQSTARNDHVHQGLAVFQSLVLTEATDSTVVAGQLPIPTAEDRRPPHKGVEPVYAQAHHPQQGPQMVSVTEVGLFVGQDMGQPTGSQ